MDDSVNFIVCDDNEIIRQNVVKIIKKTMEKGNLNYKIHVFSDFDSNFMNIVKDKLVNKIYILDIETPTKSGIDVARKIREYDYDSVIMFLTAHNELGYNVLQNEFMFLAFINKFDDYARILSKAIDKAIKIIGKKQVIKFEDRGTLYTIPIKDILYITKDSVERRVIIITDYMEIRINLTLAQVSEMLGECFKQTHRACFVNMNRVICFDTRKNLITFDNKMTTDLVSKMYKKGVRDYV